MTSAHRTDPEPEPSPPEIDPPLADVYDEDETEQIAERLTALGYIE